MGEYRNTPGVAPPVTSATRRSNRRRILLSVLMGLTGLFAAGHWIQVDRFAPASGYLVTAGYVEVRAPAAGRVRAIAAGTGDRVTSGALLVQLEDDTERAEWNAACQQADKAEAELALRSAEWRERERTHAQQLATARLQLDHARERLALTRQLVEQGLASRLDLSDDTLRLHTAEGNHDLLEGKDGALEEHALNVARHELEARRDAVNRARIQMESRALRAPMDGMVLRYTFHPGEVVRPEQLLFELFGGDEWVLQLRVPERFAGIIRLGQTCEARLETHPGFNAPRFRGVVSGMRDVIQTDARQATYRMVYVTLDATDREIHPGSTAHAFIRYGRGTLWQILFNY